MKRESAIGASAADLLFALLHARFQYFSNPSCCSLILNTLTDVLYAVPYVGRSRRDGGGGGGDCDGEGETECLYMYVYI